MGNGRIRKIECSKWNDRPMNLIQGKHYLTTVDLVRKIKSSKTKINFLLEKSSNKSFHSERYTTFFDESTIYNSTNNCMKKRCNGKLIKNKTGECMLLYKKDGSGDSIKTTNKTSHYCDECYKDQPSNFDNSIPNIVTKSMNPFAFRNFNFDQESQDEKKHGFQELKIISELLQGMQNLFESSYKFNQKRDSLMYRDGICQNRSIQQTMSKCFGRNATSAELKELDLISNNLFHAIRFLENLTVLFDLTKVTTIDQITQQLSKSKDTNLDLSCELDFILTSENILKLIMSKTMNIQTTPNKYDDGRTELVFDEQIPELTTRQNHAIESNYGILQ